MEIGITINDKLVYNGQFFNRDNKEKFAGMVLKNDRLNKCAVFLIAGLNYAAETSADIGSTMAKMDNAGFTFLGLTQRIGFWVCLIGCLLEILFAVFKEGRGKNALLPIALKWLGIFSSFYILPACFELIRDLFS